MYEFLEYQVGDAMTYRPVTITRATPLVEVEALFERYDFNCLPVSEEGALLGIVTKLDVLKAFGQDVLRCLARAAAGERPRFTPGILAGGRDGRPVSFASVGAAVTPAGARAARR